VTVHRELGTIGFSDLRRVSRLIGPATGCRTLLVQWVPHAFGYRSMNVAFCWWLWERAVLRGDRVEIVLHEPFLGFSASSWKQSTAALVQRAMTIVLLRAASHVWATIPAWERRWRPYALGRAVPFTHLPVMSTLPVLNDAARVAAIRTRLAPSGGHIVGHFSTFASATADALRATLPILLERDAAAVAVLLGRGGNAVRDELVRQHPGLSTRVHATGLVPPADLSLHLQACDLAIQPYPDGVTSRRTTVMALLAHGVPIATTVGTLTEPFWRSVDAVRLVPAGSSSALAMETARLLADAPSRARLAQAARTLYAERFDVAQTIAVLRRAPAVSSSDAGRVPA